MNNIIFFGSVSNLIKKISIAIVLGSASASVFAQLNCSFSVAREWEKGAIAQIVISNKTGVEETVENVIVQFANGVSVKNAWNASYVGENPYVFTGPPNKLSLKNGEALAIGMEIEKSVTALSVPQFRGSCTSK